MRKIIDRYSFLVLIPTILGGLFGGYCVWAYNPETDFTLCTASVNQPECYDTTSPTPTLNWTVEGSSYQRSFSLEIDDDGEIGGEFPSPEIDRYLSSQSASYTILAGDPSAPPSWIQRYLPNSAYFPNGITDLIHNASAGKYVATGEYDTTDNKAVIFESSDLTNWTMRDMGSNTMSIALTYNPSSGLYVLAGKEMIGTFCFFGACHNNAVIWYSSDLINWEKVTVDSSSDDQEIYDIIYNPIDSNYVAMGEDEGDLMIWYTSDLDGGWAKVTVTDSGSPRGYSLIYANGKYYIAGEKDGQPKAWDSSNLIGWAERSVDGGNGEIYSIIYDSNSSKYLAVGEQDSNATLWESDNGTLWTERIIDSSFDNQSARDIGYNSNKSEYFIVGNSTYDEPSEGGDAGETFYRAVAWRSSNLIDWGSVIIMDSSTSKALKANVYFYDLVNLKSIALGLGDSGASLWEEGLFPTGVLQFNREYYWRVRIRDNFSSLSDWVYGDTPFTTNGVCFSGPEAIGLLASEGDYCAVASHSFSWIYSSEPSGNPESRFQFQVDDKSDFVDCNAGSNCEVDRDYIGLSNPSGSTNQQLVEIMKSPLADQVGYNKSYYWRVKVYDDLGNDSGWTDGGSFTTKPHRYPYVNFSWEPVEPSAKESVQFTNNSVCYDANSDPMDCPGDAYFWIFVGGVPNNSVEQNPVVEFSSKDSKNVTLQIIDADSNVCQRIKVVEVKPKPPFWREIIPWL